MVISFLKQISIIPIIFLFLVSCEKLDQSEKIIILGTSPDYPPFEYKNGEQIAGFDIELAQNFAKSIDAKLVIKDMDFNSLIPALKANKVDFLMSGLTITDERKESVDFSDSYYENSFSVLTKASTIIDENNLNRYKIGAQLGSTMEILLKKLDHNYIYSLVQSNTLVQELLLNRIDGVIFEEVQCIEFMKTNSDLKCTNLKYDFIKNDGYAVAFAKNSALRDEFNQFLKDFRSSGELQKLEDKIIRGKEAKTNKFLQSLLQIPKGALITLQYTFTSAFFGVMVGIVLAMFKTSKNILLQAFATLYLSIFRGTPLMVQLCLIYFGLPSVVKMEISPFIAGVIAFSLNSGAYVSESIRSGIRSIDIGQFEAAKALGLSKYLMMKDIILPQAIRTTLPSLMNELINLVKETAILSVIGVSDVMRKANLVGAEYYTFFEPYLMAAFTYYIIVLVLSAAARLLEKRLLK